MPSVDCDMVRGIDCDNPQEASHDRMSWVCMPEILKKTSPLSLGSLVPRLPLTYDPSASSGSSHAWSSLLDPGGGEKLWTFSTASDWTLGLPISAQDRKTAGSDTGANQRDFVWAQDVDGNVFLNNVVTTIDLNTPHQKQSKTEQVVDTHGSVVEMKLYTYGDLTTPARTYTNTYYRPATLTNFDIWDLLATSTLSDGTETIMLVSNEYDLTSPSGCQQSPPSGFRNWEIGRRTRTSPNHTRIRTAGR